MPGVYATKGPIEAKYQAQGPWGAVSTVTSSAPCDRENNLCDVWYPTNLGTNPITGAAGGFRHPVIVWANGSGQPTTRYAYFIRHLASWGFIVVASRDTGTGNGGTVLDAADYIINRGNAASDLFSGKVDGANVGASGHSQGGNTIVKIASEGAGPFKAFVPIHGALGIFSQICCDYTTNTLVATMPATKSILYLSGFLDTSHASSSVSAYDNTASAATKAVGILQATNHDDILGAPDCASGSAGGLCAVGSYGYLGYSTAWFIWKLQGATDVRAAFAPGGEFRASNAGWNYNASNVN